MLDPIANPKCFSAFNSARRINKEQSAEAPLNVKAASVVGSGIGALGAAYLFSRRQSRPLKPVGIFGIKYSEPELIGVAIASILGGLGVGGLVDDKKHFPIKLKEGVHQVIANVLAPLLLISGLNRIYDKYPIKRFPQFSDNKGFKKFANEAVKMLPGLCIATAGLIGGIALGTTISNKINGLDGTNKERHVKAVDYIYHPDDFAAVFAIADKKGVLQKFVSKIIPPVFMLHGYDTGTRR